MDKNKLFVLCGKSACGKDTIIKQLVQDYGYKRVISYTTRPIREGETDGVEYHFVSDKMFKTMIENGEIIEYNTFETALGKWYYGTHVNIKDEIKKSNLICIKEPKGTQQLINALGDSVVPILIERPLYDRFISSLNRQPNATDEQVEEMCRRALADKNDFIEIETENICKINNNILSETTYLINEYIKGKDYLYWNCADDIKVEDHVIITNIKSENGKHLSSRIGETGVVFSYLIKSGQKRYKIIFDRDSDTAYFRRSELEKIEKEGR